VKRAAKKRTALAKVAVRTLSAPLPAFVKDDELIQGRPDVIANGMLGRVQELVAMAAHMSADVARGNMTGPALMQFSASVNQIAMILAHQGMGLQAEAKRQEDVRAEERNIVLVANKSGAALKLLRICLSQFGSEWAFHRYNDETGVMSRVPMGKLIGDLLQQADVIPVNEGDAKVETANAISESERQRRTTEARLAAAGGRLVTDAEAND
jgi:hypothetical protein